MNRIVVLVLISLLLLTNLTSVESFTFESKIHPTRWDMPSPLEIRGFLPSAEALKSLSVEIWDYISFGGDNLLHVSDNLCYAVLENVQAVAVKQLPSQDTIKLEISLDSGLTNVKEFYIRCEDVTISRPLNVDPTSEITRTYLNIKRDTKVSTIQVHMVQHPTVIHNYQWKSLIGAVVAVKFSFYRPSTMSDVAEFYLDHPLLQLKRITSPQLPLGTLYVEDLRRPYHLLKRDDYTEGIICSSSNQSTPPSRILFQRDPILDEVIPLVSLPTAAVPDQPYSCSFTIEYPADVIQASMYPMQNTHEDIKITIRRRSDGASFTDIPFGIPDMIPSVTTSESPVSVLVWHSPHHLHDNMMDFEIAIATTSLNYYSNKSPTKINILSSPSNELIFELTPLRGGSPSTLLDWNPTIYCRQHNRPIGSTSTHSNGVINLSGMEFHGLGKKCEVILRNGPANALYRIAVATGHSGNDLRYYTSQEITLFDAFHSQRSREIGLTLYDASSVISNRIRWNHRFIFLDTDVSTGTNYVTATMNLQYLLPYPNPRDNWPLFLHLAFRKQSELLKVVTGDTLAEIHVHRGSSSYSILSDNVVMKPFYATTFHNVLPGIDEPNYFPNEVHHNPHFQASRPLRAPGLVFKQPLLLDTAQPLRITLQWELPETTNPDDIPSLIVYPFLSPNDNIGTLTYSPIFARFTTARNTPLTGYSYRCVTWDRMVALYVYDESSSVNLTPETTVPCPSHPEGDPAKDPYWRRIAYDDPNIGPTCFYELAAVCVTPSFPVDSKYDLQPLADCPSLHGAIHALPCSAVEDDVPTWNYSLDSLTAKDSVSYRPTSSQARRSLTLWWTYKGHARRTLTVSISLVAGNSETDDDGDGDGDVDVDVDNDNDDKTSDEHETRWVTLARDIPASLSPQPGYQGATIDFPILSSHVKHVYVRITLNGAPDLHAMVKIEHTMTEYTWGPHQKACGSSFGKVFDDLTHLCKCADGLVASGPTSVENPLVYPLDFSCEEKPQEQVPINPEQCHTIPEGVTPPYFTQDCGYGFAVSTNGKCDECTCFNAWKKGSNDDEDNNNNDNEGKKCERCRLKDVCILQHTADITFKPEYCLVERCLCKSGYSGDKCQYEVMYGTLAYHDVATDEQKTNPSLIAATKEHPVIVPRRQITTFQPRVANNVKMSLSDTPVEAFVQQATQVLSEDGEEVITSIVVALGRLAPFLRATASASPFTSTSGRVANLNDLHYAWEHLQNNYQDRPVYKDDDYGTLNGGVGSAYDPHCVPNAYIYCPDGKEDDLLPPESQVDEDELKDMFEEEEGSNGPIIDDDDDNSSSSNTTAYIIIGVVLGVVLILFIALIVAILYCRKHGKMCFRKRRSKDNAASGTHSVELASSSNNSNKSNTATPASAAPPPSSTTSTSSYLPTQVQVEDPTLPADWIALEDKSTGKIYYSNKVTMESSWDHPAQPNEKVTSNAYGW